MIAYLNFAKGYYVKNGRTTKEYSCLKEAFAFVRPLYGGHLADEFGPLALKTVRQKMIDADHARGTINKAIARIVRMFRWAVAEQLIQPATSLCRAYY
jgi:hypothetical protein